MIDTTEIKVYMTRRGNMSITELAYLLGKSPATVGRWFERGDMPVQYAEKIIEILEIPLVDAVPIFFSRKVAGYATFAPK